MKNGSFTNFWFDGSRNWFMIHESWTFNSNSALESFYKKVIHLSASNKNLNWLKMPCFTVTNFVRISFEETRQLFWRFIPKARYQKDVLVHLEKYSNVFVFNNDSLILRSIPTRQQDAPFFWFWEILQEYA